MHSVNFLLLSTWTYPFFVIYWALRLLNVHKCIKCKEFSHGFHLSLLYVADSLSLLSCSWSIFMPFGRHSLSAIFSQKLHSGVSISTTWLPLGLVVYIYILNLEYQSSMMSSPVLWYMRSQQRYEIIFFDVPLVTLLKKWKNTKLWELLPNVASLLESL